MNPISGTFRHPAGGATAETLTEFLSVTKETEELFMVVDEELKMMSAVCTDGGRITGPHLKEMSRLTHTEYMLRGPQPPRSARHPARDDVRADRHRLAHAERVHRHPAARALAPRVLLRRRGALHAAPRRPATTVAAGRADARPRRSDPHPHRLSRRRRLRVPVGATLVRHSDPYGEVSETHGKAAGVLGAIGAIPRDSVVAARGRRIDEDAPTAGRALGDDPQIAALLASRNARLAPFWLNPQDAAGDGPFAGHGAIVVDAEDRFTTMLAHQLRHSASTPASCRGTRSPTSSSTRRSSSSPAPVPAIRATR